MRSMKKYAAALVICAVVSCGALMPAAAYALQNQWLHIQTDTREMELLTSIDLSDPSVLDAFRIYSSHIASIPMRQGRNLSEQQAIAVAQDTFELLQQNGLIPDLELSNQQLSVYPRLLISDTAEMESALIWDCSWGDADTGFWTIEIDDTTAKMLSLQIYLSNDEAIPSVADFEKTAAGWLDFCRSYYGGSNINMTKDTEQGNVWTLTFPVSSGNSQWEQSVQLVIDSNMVYFH